MALAPGVRLGPCQVIAQIGVGGWRACNIWNGVVELTGGGCDLMGRYGIDRARCPR